MLRKIKADKWVIKDRLEKGRRVQVGKFTSICTLFIYRDREKYAMIYEDMVFGESAENLEKSRKNEVILRYARKS